MSLSESNLPQSVHDLPFDICQERRELDRGASRGFTKAWNIFGRYEDKDLARARYFSKRHFIFVLDNSATMSQHWPLVTFVAETLARDATGHDTEGLDIKFPRHNNVHKNEGLKGENGRRVLKRTLILATPHYLASGIDEWNNLWAVFSDIITEWLYNGKRPTTLMVFTDGAWLEKHGTSSIETLLNVVAKEKKARAQRIFTIQFIRFGDSAPERDRLQDLAEDCYYLTDIIDHCSWRATVERMFIGAIDYLGDLRIQEETENPCEYEDLLKLFKSFNKGERKQEEGIFNALADLFEPRELPFPRFPSPGPEPRDPLLSRNRIFKPQPRDAS